MPSSTGETIGVGIAGLSADGGWAATAHVPALRAVRGVELRGLVASSWSASIRAAERFEVPHPARSVEELAARDDVDVVVIAVRVPKHAAIVRAAQSAGAAVLCEWPMSLGHTEAVELAGGSAGLRTFIGLQGRFAPATAYVRELVTSGYVGDVLSTTLFGTGPAWGSPVPARQAYVLKRTNGATLLSIPFAHSLDVVEQVLGGLSQLTATIAGRRNALPALDTGELLPMDTEDQVVVSGRLESGAVVVIHYRGGTARGGNLVWDITGTKGELRIESSSGSLQLGEIRVSGGRHADTGLQALEVPSSHDGHPSLRGTPAHGVAHLYDHLRSDLRDDTRLVPTFEDAVRLHAVLDTIRRDAATTRVVVR